MFHGRLPTWTVATTALLAVSMAITVPSRPLEPGEVRVAIKAALTCGTDLKVFKRGYHAKMIVPPAVFGHELAGVIAERGAPEYAKVRLLIEQGTGQELVPELLFGVVPLAFAMKLAEEASAGVFDHFRSFASMSPRMLPVLMATKNGVQASGHELFPAKGGRG